MKTWKKVIIAVLGSGINGGLAYASSLYPDWSMICSSLTVAVSGAMSILIGWPPKGS